MESKLIIRHVSLSKDFVRDKDGNSTGIPAVIVYYTAETLIPGSPRYCASFKVQESKLREFAEDLDNLPIDFLKQFSHIGRGFEDIHKKYYYACYNNEEEIYEQALALFKEGVPEYFKDGALWQKHLCTIHELKAGETVTLSNGFTFTVKEPVRIVGEPHDKPWIEL